MKFIAPAQIFVGSHPAMVDAAIHYAQELFCTKNNCGNCTTCRQLREQQFYAVTWLSPEKNYSLDDLEPILTTTAYALGIGQHHLFVIQQAELLTTACSNSLLKIIEEPPAGYHFLFLTNRLHALLATIRSRCMVQMISTKGSAQESFSELATHFKQVHATTPTAFLKIIDQEKLHENESMAIIDELINYWLEKNNAALLAGKIEERMLATSILTILQQALHEPPMPGSSKIFWRNLYNKIQEIC